jgi:putative isomerase
MTEYELVQQRLAHGWNTWNTRSVLSHVLLPEGFTLNLGLREYVWRRNLREALIGRRGMDVEHIHPGAHAYDGSYSELNLKWLDNEFLVQSATVDEDLVLLVTPLARHPQAKHSPLLIIEAGILWNRPGTLMLDGDMLSAQLPTRCVCVYSTQPAFPEAHIYALTPYLTLLLDGPAGVSTGRRRSVVEIQKLLAERKATFAKSFEKYGELAEVYRALQTAMAWDTIYEPEHQRVVSPVSRIWNVIWGGYVLFEWDNYFAAYMAAAENKDLAYANAVEMTREMTEDGLVPNFATSNGVASRDRSEPPVGAIICRELFRMFRETWFLEEVFPNLLRWNRWWHEKRHIQGLLCWGSHPYPPVIGSDLETNCINERQGGAWESGLDNLPVYDDVPFDTSLHLLMLHDVGLNGLYVADCEALADIAHVLRFKYSAEEFELRKRAAAYRKELAALWDEPRGFYYNRRLDTGEFSPRISPTSFYPLIGRVPSQQQAERIVAEHFTNPKEFWGEWMLPMISRDDPAYSDQDYWRGRIWGPTNFLVYLGLRNYALPQACKDLAEKSVKLLMKEWLVNGHVHENYNADTGEGCDKENSDAFYHWGALLGAIALIEAGHLPAPEESL